MEDIVECIKHTFARLMELPVWKTLLGALIAVGHFLFGQMRPALSAIMVLFCMDFLSGFAYAVMQKDIESKRLMRGAVKLAIYGNLLIVARQCLVSEVLIVIGAGLSGLVDGYIVLTEAISVIENLDKIARLYRVELPFLRRLIRYLWRERRRQGENLERREEDR